MKPSRLALSVRGAPSLPPSCGKDTERRLEKSFGKIGFRAGGVARHSGPVEMDWVGRALGRAFPEAQSENELCELAAEVLSTADHTVTSRTVRNWVRGNNTPHFRYIRSILVLAGAEAVFKLIDAEPS